MKKEMISNMQITLPEGECRLEYYLCERPESYGVEIVKKKCDTGKVVESEGYSDVCCSRNRTQYMLRQMAKNTVTPISLSEVMEALMMDAEEACIQMELLGHNFFVFRNAETDEVNVVYKRKGNTYGLIEPEY